MIKKLTAFGLAIMLLLQSYSVFAGPWDYIMEEYLYDHGVEEANGEIYYTPGTNEISRKIKFSMDMGLISKYVPGTTVTRLELKNALNLLFKNDEMYNKHYKPGEEDKILTVDEAIITFMDSAGYGAYFEYNGSTGTTDYYKEASRQGLLDGINYTEAKKKLTAEQFYNMFYNLLDVKTFEMVLQGSGQSYKFSDLTLLDTDLKLTRISGVVSANSYTSINGSASAGDGSLRIDNTEYRCGGIKNADDFLGYKIEAYINKDGEICSAAVDERYNDMKSFNDSVDTKLSGDRTLFQYYDDNGSLKSVRLYKYADVIYNHIAYPGYTEDIYNIKNGYIQFIDHNNDGLYDVLFVYEYTSFMPNARYAEDYSVVDKLGTKYNVSDIVSNNKYKGIFNSKGEEAEFEDINMRKGISLLTAPDSNVVTELYILDEQTVEGKYSEFRGDTKLPYKIENQSFDMAATYYKESNGKLPHSIGDRILIYLDPRGKIINSVAVDNRLKYGYARRLGADYKITPNVKIQLFTEDGQMMTYEFADKVEYNGTMMEEADIINGGAVELYKNKNLKKQLVRYMLSSNGEVKKIDTAKSNTEWGSYNDGDDFEINYDYETQGNLVYLGGTTKSFGAMYRLNQARTAMFHIPDDDNERYYRVSSTESISNNEEYRVKIYDVDDCYTPEAIVMVHGSAGSSNWLSSEWLTSCFVLQTGDYYDKVNEEALQYITYRASWWEQTAYKSPDSCKLFDNWGSWKNGGRAGSVKNWEDIRKGDMIEFNGDYTGRVTLFGVSLALDYNKPLAEQTFEKAKVLNNSGKGWGVGEKQFYAQDLVAFGKVIKKHNEGMVLNSHGAEGFPKAWNRTIVCGETTYVNCYTIGKDECSLLRFSDIQEGDYVFVELHSGSLNAISVYRP